MKIEYKGTYNFYRVTIDTEIYFVMQTDTGETDPHWTVNYDWSIRKGSIDGEELDGIDKDRKKCLEILNILNANKKTIKEYIDEYNDK